MYKDEGAAELDTPTFIFSAPITPNQYGNTWSSSALLDRLLPRVEEVATVQVAKSLTPPSEMVGRGSCFFHRKNAHKFYFNWLKHECIVRGACLF